MLRKAKFLILSSMVFSACIASGCDFGVYAERANERAKEIRIAEEEAEEAEQESGENNEEAG